MRLGTIAFLAGILLFHSLPEIPCRGWALGLPVALVLIVWSPALRLPACGLAGFFWVLFWVDTPSQLPAELQSVDLRAEGWIASIPVQTPRSSRFRFQVARLWHEDTPIPFKGLLQLAWYDTPPLLRVGDKWSLTVRLKRPRGLANPGGFDYERWLFVNHLRARGYVRNHPSSQFLISADRYSVDRFRQRLGERISRLLADSPYRGILMALAVGDRQGISERQWRIFTRTGTGHLMAISGLHVGLVAGLVLILVRSVWGWSAPLAQRFSAIKAAAVIALLGAGGYALLAGLSLPTQRALIMVAVVFVALLWQRSIVPSRILALALLAVLIVDPFAPLAGGFWLSFGAVGVILYTLTGRGRSVESLSGWIRLQLAIVLALLPATLILFQSVSWLSPVANLIAIPWASVTVVPLTLLSVLLGFFSETLQLGVLQLAALATDWLWRFLVWLGSMPWASISLPAPPLWALGFAVPGLLLLLAPRGMPGRWLGLALCLPLLCSASRSPGAGEVWFSLLDVGPGLAAVIRTSHRVLVYDTGPRRGTGFDAGRIALAPFLVQQGVRRIDTLIVSHADSGHAGGTRSLLERFPVERILTSSPRDVPIEGAEACRADQAWIWDEVRFRFLHPPESGGFSADDASCVLLVESKDGRRILLTGDIESGAEAALLRRFGSALAADIMVAPHHGTRNLSLPEFIAAVKPRYVLLSTAYKNPFGYPRPKTVARYRAAGASIWDTSRYGAITFYLDDEHGVLIPEAHRQQARRYWHTP